MKEPIILYLINMGIRRNRAEKAVIVTKSRGIDHAANWWVLCDDTKKIVFDIRFNKTFPEFCISVVPRKYFSCKESLFFMFNVVLYLIVSLNLLFWKLDDILNGLFCWPLVNVVSYVTKLVNLKYTNVATKLFSIKTFIIFDL